MSANEAVIIKGTRDGLLILLDDHVAWPVLLGDLDDRLAARRSFFQGATVTANLSGRILDEPEFRALRELLTRYEMTLHMIVSSATQTRAVAGVNGVRNRAPGFVRIEPADPLSATPAEPPPLPSRPPGSLPEPPPAGAAPGGSLAAPTPNSEPDFLALAGEDTVAVVPEWVPDAAALFVRRTLRSGMRLVHEGAVCILGDVNAGAEIVAGGDVVVWGVLRGQVHAGAGGDHEAVVCALHLAPTQIRIAEVVSRGSAPPVAVAPEMARIVHGRILVEPWTGRRR